MSKFTVSTLVFATLLAGCSGEGITSASPSQLQTATQAVDVSRPFSGDCELGNGVLVFTSPTTALLTADGTCQLTHLGSSTISIREMLDFVASSYSNEATITAANGDVLRLTISGLATPSITGVTLAGTAVINGGTGRFEDATGTAAHTGVVVQTVSPLVATYHLSGRVTY
jgi:hypothetical protein